MFMCLSHAGGQGLRNTIVSIPLTQDVVTDGPGLDSPCLSRKGKGVFGVRFPCYLCHNFIKSVQLRKKTPWLS